MSEDKKNESISDETNRSGALSIQFSDLWKGFVKYWWIAVVLSVAIGAVVFVRSYSKFSPQYKVSTTFTVNTQILSLTGEGIPSYSFYYDNATATQLADTFPYILSSNILNEAICDDLGISYIPVSLSAAAVASTNMFTLTATGSDAQKTYDVLCSAMKNYPTAAKYLVGNVKLTVITEPEFPTEMSNKFTFSVALKGILIGFSIGALWIVIYAAMRKTVKTRSDIVNKIKIEAIGTIPEVTFKKYKDVQIDRTILMTNDKIGKGFLEAVRIYRNSFINILKENEKVIMTTSTAPGEGKTTAAVNLALSLVDLGKKVLVVEGDLRNPSVAPLLGIDVENIKYQQVNEYYSIAELSEYGISYLKFNAGEGKYWKVIKIDLLKKIFDEVRGDYDYVLVDTPPCGLVSDSIVIAQACDALIYVILQDTVRIKKIMSAVDTLLPTGVRVLGAVINGARSGLAGYGDNYGYGYSYGYMKNYSKYGYGYDYGYGYGYSYGTKKRKTAKDVLKEALQKKMSEDDNKK